MNNEEDRIAKLKVKIENIEHDKQKETQHKNNEKTKKTKTNK